MQSGSVAHCGEKDRAVPQKIPGPETSLIKEKGQEAPNSSLPRTHRLCLIQPPSCNARGGSLPGRRGKENSSVPNCTEVNQPVTKQAQRRTPGSLEERKRKGFVLCGLFIHWEITSLSTPVCTVLHSIRASLFTEIQSTLQEMGAILQGA